MKLQPFDAAHILVAAEVDAKCFPIQNFSVELLQQLVSSPQVMGYLAHHDDEVIGYMLVRHAAGEAEILTIAVLEKYRRKGYAEEMLTTCFTELQSQQVEKVYLEVRVSNTAACKLYEKFGGQQVAIRPKYYEAAAAGQMEDAFVYCIVL